VTDEDRVGDGSWATGSRRPVEQGSDRSMSAARPPLASLLAEAGVASEEQLRLAVAEGMGSGERLGEIVLRRGWIDEAGLAQLLARQWGLVYLADEAAVVEQSTSALLSAQEAERLGVCVIGFVEGLPLVAVAEPAEDRFADVRSALGRECDFAVVSKSTLERLVAQRVSADGDEHAVSARAAMAQTADDAEAERLLGELDTAATTLLAWAERVKRVVELQQQTEGQLSASREEIVAVREELARERATVDRLERELAHQHELMSAAKAKLADVARTLEAE
jgi:Type II secretion system (T2SS), protein E, N-terminal domain